MHPFLVLSPSLRLPIYILVISITCSICLLWAYRKAKSSDQEVKLALDLSLMIMIGGFLGGRLFHVFYEGFDYYKLFPIDALRFWDGGFVYFGGWMGGCLLALLAAKIFKADIKYWLDFFAPILAFGYGLGRMACFLNGCCYGDLCDLPWAIEFSYPGLPSGERHPTQLYATAWELFITLPILFYLGKKWVAGTGRVFFSWMIAHGLGRLVMETFRDDERGQAILNISISSWISFAMISLGLFLLLKSFKKN